MLVFVINFLVCGWQQPPHTKIRSDDDTLGHTHLLSNQTPSLNPLHTFMRGTDAKMLPHPFSYDNVASAQAPELPPAKAQMCSSLSLMNPIAQCLATLFSPRPAPAIRLDTRMPLKLLTTPSLWIILNTTNSLPMFSFRLRLNALDISIQLLLISLISSFAGLPMHLPAHLTSFNYFTPSHIPSPT